jgi:hypothetical protein
MVPSDIPAPADPVLILDVNGRSYEEILRRAVFHYTILLKTI